MSYRGKITSGPLLQILGLVSSIGLLRGQSRDTQHSEVTQSSFYPLRLVMEETLSYGYQKLQVEIRPTSQVILGQEIAASTPRPLPDCGVLPPEPQCVPPVHVRIVLHRAGTCSLR
jgi:hypothetical protein